jgi:hypothetical protein
LVNVRGDNARLPLGRRAAPVKAVIRFKLEHLQFESIFHRILTECAAIFSQCCFNSAGRD